MGDIPRPLGPGEEYSQQFQQQYSGSQQSQQQQQQQHVFAPLYDIPQQHQQLGQQFAPYNMTSVMHALPPQNYRPAQQHQHQQYGGTGAMSPMPTNPYYMSQQPQQHQHQQHGPGMQYYVQQMQGHQQPREAMSPRANMAFYQQPHAQGQQYYFPPGTQFSNHGHAGQYDPSGPMHHVDHRLAHHQHQKQQQQQHQPQQQISSQPTSGTSFQSSSQADAAKNDSRSSVVRGPPRKPRQSGHAIWIGNLPPQTDLMSLVYHVCKEAPGLESLFLISKSNCAFANFKDDQACTVAQKKVHDSKFQSVRLVSRLRKSTVEGASGLTAPTGPAASTPMSTASQEPAGDDNMSATAPPDDADAALSPSVASPEMESPKVASPDRSTPQKEKYFILKSLTVEDLEQSIKTGIWATQAHNEKALNKAFETTAAVFLIFSANKSGEYFGYARMTSSINEDPAAAIEFAPKAQVPGDVGLPKAIPTEANEFVPKGSIMDDSERGTIFWEAELSEDALSDEGAAAAADGQAQAQAPAPAEDAASVKSGDAAAATDAKTWGKPFQLEWLSTSRLPFYRTRGIRNPWNSNREVKIARDGTELEPGVGRKLTALFVPRAQQQQQQQQQQAASMQHMDMPAPGMVAGYHPPPMHQPFPQ